MDTLMSEYQKMRMRVEGYEMAQEDLETAIRYVSLRPTLVCSPS